MSGEKYSDSTSTVVGPGSAGPGASKAELDLEAAAEPELLSDEHMRDPIARFSMSPAPPLLPLPAEPHYILLPSCFPLPPFTPTTLPHPPPTSLARLFPRRDRRRARALPAVVGWHDLLHTRDDDVAGVPAPAH